MIRPFIPIAALLLLPGCLLTPPQRDVDWSGPPVATERSYPSSRYPQTSRERYGVSEQERERRRIIAEEDRRRAQIERERQADERKLKAAAQSQAQSSCTQARIDRTLCRNLAAIGSILIP